MLEQELQGWVLSHRSLPSDRVPLVHHDLSLAVGAL